MSRIGGGIDNPFEINSDNDGEIVGNGMYEDAGTSRQSISNGIIDQIGGGKEYGFNLANVVDAMVTGEMGDTIPSLEREITNTNVRVSAVSKLENIMRQLQKTTLSPLEMGLSPYILNASDPNAVTVSASDNDRLQSIHPFTVEASQLAQSNTWVFTQAQVSEKASIKGSGSLEIQLGNGEKQTVTIAANSSLDDIADKINTANVGVDANVVKQSDGYHLVFTSENTGVGNEISMNFTPDADSDDLNTLFSSKHEQQVAKDASFTINGVDMVSGDNTVTYEGVHVTLNKINSPSTVSTSAQVGEVSKAVNGFIANYNELITSLNHLNASVPGKQYQGSLHNDDDLASVMSQLKNTVINVLPNNESLYALGIDVNDDGSLIVNQSKLNSALSKDPSIADSLFATHTSASVSELAVSGFNKSANTLEGETKSGTYTVNVTQAPESAQHQMTNALTLNGSGKVDISSDVTLNMSLFGEATPGNFSGESNKTAVSIKIPQGEYTPAELAEKIQSEVNSTPGVKSNHSDIKVSIKDNHLVFESNHVGALTGFNITSDKSANVSSLGIVAGDMDKTDGYVGKNIIGTINGQLSLSDGRYLKAQDDITAGKNATGMTVKVSGNQTGEIGTVTLNRGYADKIDGLIGGFTHYSDLTPEKSGLLARKLHDYQEDLNAKNLNSLVNQLKEAQAKKSTLTQRYLEKYKGVNSILAEMSSEQSYIKMMFNNNSDSDNNQ